MNALLILLAAMVLSGKNPSEIINLLKNIDFTSFRPILSLLGLNGKAVDFICSEKFSEFLDGGGDLSKIPELIGAFMTTPAENSPENISEKDCGLEPIKPVAPSEIEESLGNYFGQNL